MIYQQLGQVCGTPGVLLLNRRTVAIWFLWAIQSEFSNKSQLVAKEQDYPQHQLPRLWDQFHTTNPPQATIYLNALLNCVDVDHNQVIEHPGSEQLARAASLCLLYVLSGADPTSMAFEAVRQHYLRIIPCNANFGGLLCYYTISVIHILFVSKQAGHSLRWMDYQPHPQEHILFAKALVPVAYC